MHNTEAQAWAAWYITTHAGRQGESHDRAEFDARVDEIVEALSPTTRHRFTVWEDGKPTQFDTLEAALRAWNVGTFGKPTPGGVNVQSYRDGLMVRDGWIVHVHDDGTVYVNPNLALA